MKPYPKYKPSGVEWLSDVPFDWEIKKLKYLVSLINEKEEDATSIEFKISLDIIEKFTGNLLDGDANFEGMGSKFKKGDVLFNKLRPYLAKAVLVEKDGIAVSELLVLRPLYLLGKFLLYRILTNDFLNIVNGATDGAKMPRANWSFIGNLKLATPSKIEQKTIVAFLDQKTAQIDQAIAEKEQLIALYQEERQAVINEAVTRGIRPGVKMKPSGVEWIGEVPEGWEVKKVKHVCNLQGRIGFKGYSKNDLVNEGEGALTLGAKHINKKNELDLSNPEYLSWEKYHESPEIMIEQGHVIVTQRGSLGKVVVIDSNIGPATINPSMILLKNFTTNQYYFYYFLNSKYFNSWIEMVTNSTAVPMISQEMLANFKILSPPIEEQEKIAEFLKIKVSKVDQIIEWIKEEIALLQEYRQALIYEAVTGKIDLSHLNKADDE